MNIIIAIGIVFYILGAFAIYGMASAFDPVGWSIAQAILWPVLLMVTGASVAWGIAYDWWSLRRTLKTAALILMLGLLASVPARAQTPTDPLNGFYAGLKNSGLLSATNYSIAPYLTYAPQAPKGSKIGGGFFTAYNFNNFVGAGLGADYLGKFSLVSANISLKYPIKLFTATNGWLSTVYLTPFTIDGVGKGLSGTDSSAVVVTDTGASLSLFKLWGGVTDVGYAYGRWDNAGVYSGPRQHLFLVWHKNF